MNTLRMFVTIAFGAALTVLLYTINDLSSDRSTATAEAQHDAASVTAMASVVSPPPEPARSRVIKHAIRKGESLGAILPRFNAPVHDVRQAALDVYDLSKIRVGRELSFRIPPDEEVPEEIRYPLDEDRTLVVSRDGTTWSAAIEAIRYDVQLGRRDLSVDSTLWGAAIDAGLRPRDIASLARVMEYDLDFNSEIRTGASARLVVEELWNDGELAKLGAPLAFILENAGKEYVAVRFENDRGETRYYDRDGISRRSAFLRSPLEFSRVTSGFNLKRYHPVLKKPRPHYGTDFGAPKGTPIRAVGDGRVMKAGRNGGHGNFIKLDHSAGPYMSSYSHLSKIAVRAGERVRQGQVIGYVGSTGLSTGPHLHYQFWVNGRIVDPMKVDLPRGERLTPAEMERFIAERDALLARLNTPVQDGERDNNGGRQTQANR